MNSNKITSLGTPAVDADAANKIYVDSYYPNSYDFKLGGLLTGRGSSNASRALVKYDGNILVLNYGKDFTGNVRVDSDLSMNSNKITSLATPTDNTDATNKSYCDSNKTIDASLLTTGTLNKDRLPSTFNTTSFGSNKITSLGTPTADRVGWG
jgi:hypothetical protein